MPTFHIEKVDDWNKFFLSHQTPRIISTPNLMGQAKLDLGRKDKVETADEKDMGAHRLASCIGGVRNLGGWSWKGTDVGQSSALELRAEDLP